MPNAPYVFVSYSSVDRERVLPLVDRLEAAGVKTWIDREGIHGGENYGQIITAAIKDAAVIMVMASDAALASRNVRQELALGWRFEKVYLPLLLDRVTVPDEVAYWLEAAQWIELGDRSESAWLTDVGQALARHAITVDVPAVQMQTAQVRERPLLVGREREQAILQEQLDRMRAGQGGTVLVGGEAGIGKTTLVEDLSVSAEEAGALVLWGHAYDLSVTPPYGPWLEIWRQYRSLGDATLPPIPPFIFDVEELAKVGSQDALFEQVAEFLHSVASQQPLVLVLDDLHWFDQASLDFARFLARKAGTQRLLLVSTYRSDELHRRHPLYTLLPLLVREAGAERVDVQALTGTGHRALIASRYLLSVEDQERLEQYLDEHAEGNPLYAGELLRTLEDAGALFGREAAWQLGDLDQVRVPPMLRQVIEGRLARLPETTRELLDVAAIIGQDVAFDLWATVAGVDEGVLVEAAEAAHRPQCWWCFGRWRRPFPARLAARGTLRERASLRRRLWHRENGRGLGCDPRVAGSGPGCLSLPASRRRASGRVADPRWRAGAACLCLVHRRRALGRGPSQDDRAASSGSGPGSRIDTHSAGHALCRSAPSRRPIGGGREAGDRDCGSWSGDPHFLPRRPLSYHYGRHPRGNAAGHPLC